MSYLSDEEFETLRVSRMIIHLVAHQDENQTFEPREEIVVQQGDFFIARIQAVAGDGVHSFIDGSRVRPIIEDMANDNISFTKGGQELARWFFDAHVRQSIGGAFFVIELRSNVPNTILYALIKYDYREAVELADNNGQSTLRAIVQAFIKDKRAVQKFCLARVRNGIADKVVCASDRMKEPPDLTDYFERYLGVRRTRSTSELSRGLNEALRGALQDLKDLLPNGDIGGAVARAKQALQGRAVVTNDDVVDAIKHAVGRPSDESISSKIEKITRKKLRSQNLQEVEFKPDPSTLRVSPRQFIRTVEEVRLEFPAEELGNSVIREEIDGTVVFTVKTKRLVEDGTIPIKTRG